MYGLEIWFKRPRKFHKEVRWEKTTMVERKITTLIEDKILEVGLVIPVSPYIHPIGIQYLAKHVSKNCQVVALLLITGLRETKQENIVTVSLQELKEMSGLTKPTIIATIDTLSELGYIQRVGKQSYKVSPRLAWYGNQVDWALALKREEDLLGLPARIENVSSEV